MKILKTAVVGVGHLGKFHAQKYAKLPQSTLVAVCDNNPETAQTIAAQYDIQAFKDYRKLIGQVDAVSIAVPTPAHCEVAHFFLEHGVHVLLEKPIATTVEQADTLINAAKKNNVVLQIGHLERFNNALTAAMPLLHNPLFIESSRLAPFKLRGSDVNVILDLMIHDIDIIQSLIQSPIKSIHANGAMVLSNFIDIANARLEFDNGCVANLTASRVSLKTERRLRIFQPDAYIGLDLDNKHLWTHKKGPHELFPGVPQIIDEHHEFDKGDALHDQIESFLQCILNNTPPLVSGEDGKQALDIAITMTQIIRKQLDNLYARQQEATID